jgi:hypothetical protein
MKTMLCGQSGRSDAHHWVGMTALSRHGVACSTLGDRVVALLRPRRGCAIKQRRRA